MKRLFLLTKSKRKGKKWMVVEVDKEHNKIGKIIHFGSSEHEDYTQHKDEYRMKSYISRHSKNDENWTKNGLETAGFWSRYLLWSKPSLNDAIEYTEKKFNIDII